MVTQKEIFFQYLLNRRNFIENEVIQLRQNLKMRNIDAVDCLELALAMERLNAFIDFSNSAVQIFNLSMPADYSVNMAKVDYAVLHKAALQLKNKNKVNGEKK